MSMESNIKERGPRTLFTVCDIPILSIPVVLGIGGVLYLLYDSIRLAVIGMNMWGEDKPDPSIVKTTTYATDAVAIGVFLVALCCLSYWALRKNPQSPVKHVGLTSGTSPRLPRFLAAVSFASLVVIIPHFFNIFTSERSVLSGSGSLSQLWNGVARGARASLYEESVDLVLIVGFPIVTAMMFFNFDRWTRIQQVPFIASLVFISSVLRGALHIYQGDYRFMELFVMGVGWGLIFIWSRSVWPVIIAHWTYHIVSSAVAIPAVFVFIAIITVTGFLSWVTWRTSAYR